MEKRGVHLAFLTQDSPIHGWDDQQLFEAQDDIEKMLASPGWQILTELLEGGYRSVQGQLMYGKVKENSGDYARELGKMCGFEFAQAAAEAVVIKAKEKQALLAKAEAELAGVS